MALSPVQDRVMGTSTEAEPQDGEPLVDISEEDSAKPPKPTETLIPDEPVKKD